MSYWEPEIVDKDVQHKMPKKFQYRWNGPFAVGERDGDHFNINVTGVKALVNPGRLRKYYTWTDDPWENEAEHALRPGKSIDSGEIEQGDMIAVALTMSETSSRPFAIGRVIAKRGIDDFLIHWFGNVTGKLEGTYKPRWNVRDGDGKVSSYYAQTKHGEVGTYAHTSEVAGVTIRRRNILHFGFQLVFNNKLPVGLKRLMHANKTIHWEIPRK